MLVREQFSSMIFANALIIGIANKIALNKKLSIILEQSGAIDGKRSEFVKIREDWKSQTFRVYFALKTVLNLLSQMKFELKKGVT